MEILIFLACIPLAMYGAYMLFGLALSVIVALVWLVCFPINVVCDFINKRTK